MQHLLIPDSGFQIRKSRRFDADAMSKPGLDFFLQSAEGTGPNGLATCRFGFFPPSKKIGGICIEFYADEIGLGVIAQVMQTMPGVTPAHIRKTIQKFGTNCEMVDYSLNSILAVA